jgi:hypothetical protein
MLSVRSVPPAVTVGLAVLSVLAAGVSPILSLGLVVALAVGLALVDGRPRTAVALVVGWALSFAAALLIIEVSTRNLPPGQGSHAGILSLMLPWLLVAMAIITAVAFVVTHHARRLLERSRGRALEPV